MSAWARAQSRTSGTAFTSMKSTLSACRLDAEYGEYSVESAGKSACTGLTPTKSAPASAARPSSSRRSVKSPMPQLFCERSAYNCAATPQSRPPAASSRGSWIRRGVTISAQRSRCAYSRSISKR
jgi:hypothetical protein